MLPPSFARSEFIDDDAKSVASSLDDDGRYESAEECDEHAEFEDAEQERDDEAVQHELLQAKIAMRRHDELVKNNGNDVDNVTTECDSPPRSPLEQAGKTAEREASPVAVSPVATSQVAAISPGRAIDPTRLVSPPLDLKPVVQKCTETSIEIAFLNNCGCANFEYKVSLDFS
jgi:hypothetical protein